jgi:hypothetical protein
MALRLGEYAVELAKAKLQANLPSRIAAINADPSLPPLDPLLAVPETYYTSGLQSIPATPAIIVVEGPASFAEEGPHTLLLDPLELGVWVLEGDPDRQALGKRLQRQTRAVIESLWDSPPLEQLSPAAFRIMPQRTQPGRTFDPDQETDAWRGFYLTIFSVQQIEE